MLEVAKRIIDQRATLGVDSGNLPTSETPLV